MNSKVRYLNYRYRNVKISSYENSLINAKHEQGFSPQAVRLTSSDKTKLNDNQFKKIFTYFN